MRIDAFDDLLHEKSKEVQQIEHAGNAASMYGGAVDSAPTDKVRDLACTVCVRPFWHWRRAKWMAHGP